MPTYQDIVDQLVADQQNTFGADIYLGIDSQDYQNLSSFAQMIYDSFLASQAAYNSRGPASAIGTGLDVVVGTNGIQRKSAVYSTANVTLAGTSGTIITGGIATDINGNSWSVTSPITIGSVGTVVCLATCQTAGAITANAGDINAIATPQLGWSGVTNIVAATVGTAVETDAQLRARQATSTAQPSKTVLEGVKGAIAAISGVTRSRVYENDTGTADSNGLPAHSITCVVEGGSASDIGNSIFDRKGPGCATNGATTVTVTDSFGVNTDIHYDVVGYTPIDVAYTVKGLSGYTSSTATAIQNAAVAFLNGSGIGNEVYVGSLWGAALGVISNPSNPSFSVVSVQVAVHLGATLTTALASGTAYTTLDVSTLTQSITSGDALVVGTGSTTQAVTASADASTGDTSITVTSFTANAAYDVGTPASFELGTADIPIAYNDAAQGVLSNISVTVQ